MADKPGDFLIGVVDFFAILLPGAVAAFFGMGAGMAYVSARPHIFGPVPPDLFADARGWAIFAIASYLLGQFIYLLGSLLDGLYDLARQFFKADWLGKSAARLGATKLARWVASEQNRKQGVFKWLNKKWAYNQGLYERAQKIKNDDVGDYDKEVVKPFQWAKACVLIHAPGAAVEIHRLEADQKFFRGLMVVLVLVCVLFRLYYKVGWAELTPYVVLLLLSFWRYVNQRRKSQDFAYTYLIALDAAHKSSGETDRGEIAGAAAPAPDEVAHAQNSPPPAAAHGDVHTDRRR